MAAKRVSKKKGPTPEEDAQEFFLALELLEKERGIKKEYMLEKITQALISAYKRDHEGVEENIVIQADPEKNLLRMIIRRDVVESVDNPGTEISLEDARKLLPRVQLGDVVSSEVKTKNFGRIAAQTARQVIIQGIREAERNMVFDEFFAHREELMTGIVTRIDPGSGALHVRLSSGKEFTDALLTAGEQVKGESYKEGGRIRVYVVDVKRETRGTRVLISRTHFGLVRRLFELEVPELFDGVVEIRSIAREAGSRTKMAVWSSQSEIDPIGACVGTRGQRVNTVVEELHGEKVDIIKYSDDPAEYVAAALAPAGVVSVTELEERSCRVIVPDDQLSLAIGKAGQNARLAARLTGFKIDIKSVSGAADEEELAALNAEADPAEAAPAGESAQDAQDAQAEPLQDGAE
jgi:N utilization substance protein A